MKCSVGVAIYPTHAQDGEQLLQRADDAMYAAKSAGKGCYRVYSGENAQPAAANRFYSFLTYGTDQQSV